MNDSTNKLIDLIHQKTTGAINEKLTSAIIQNHRLFACAELLSMEDQGEIILSDEERCLLETIWKENY